MEYETSTVGAVTVLAPKGALVQDDADRFANTLTEAISESYGRLVLDVSAVPYVDSRALEVLVDATDHLGQSGQTLKLCGGTELLREVLDLTELDSLFEHYADVNAAARSYL